MITDDQINKSNRTRDFRGPLTIKIIEDGYFSLVYGYTEPNQIKCNNKMANRIKKLCLMGDLMGDGDNIRFNNADVIIDESIIDNQIIIGFKVVPTHFKSLPGIRPFSIIDIED